MKQIYLDYAATTPVDDTVLEAMLPLFKDNFGNASSFHHAGQAAKITVEESRERIAQLIGAEPSEIVFTSGGTESDNTAIKGTLAASGNKNEIVSSDIEHHAVLHPVEMSKLLGYKTIFAAPGSNGVITAEAVERCITDKTALVSIMHVNNEIGTINRIKEIAAVCRERNIPFHTDAVQSLGKLPVNVKEMGINFLSASAHKIYGPKGVGFLYIKKGTPWLPWQTGGSQENRRRGGTHNVPGIAGFARALQLANEKMTANTQHYTNLRRLLLSELDRRGISYKINGAAAGNTSDYVPHILNLSVAGKNGQRPDGELLLFNLDLAGICVSKGSACTSGSVEPSHVLAGIGVPEEEAAASLRISFGQQTTEDEIRYFASELEKILQRILAAA